MGGIASSGRDWRARKQFYFIMRKAKLTEKKPT